MRRACGRLMFGWMLCTAPLHAYAQHADGFAAWLADFQAQAVGAGIAPNVARQALSGIELDDNVIALDTKQPETKITLEKYLGNTINARRIRIGKALLQEHRAMLAKIAAQYHVQPKYLVALWGIESDYGAHQGNFSVVQSLATLAYEGRRRELFSSELIAALTILQNESMRSDALTGSWAGAMGNCQFMPSTFLAYAVDGDGDGHRDIWNSVPDTLASIANYLHALGWNDKRNWGGWAVTPDNFRWEEADIDHSKTEDDWRARGFRFPHAALGGKDLFYAIYPSSKEANGGALLVTENFKAILQWNRSRYFAIAVGTLADAIGDGQ